ncbi:hypothetical protein [Streptomyces sp. NPDC057287]|uniref:hypothetical protein n=1 Tax=Streptomyces sp. NPDC057287 TaxID=3346086 RepID=UPI00362F2A63
MPVAVWVVAAVAGVVSAGLIVAFVVGPDMADRAVSVTGAIVGIAVFILFGMTLVRSSGVRSVWPALGGFSHLWCC